MLIQESSEQGSEVCKALGLEFNKQYKFEENQYIMFHDDKQYTNNYSLLLNFMLGKYNLIPINVMEMKKYKFAGYEKIVDNLPKDTFKCMKHLMILFTSGIPQDAMLNFSTDNAQLHVDCVNLNLYIPYVREALKADCNLDIVDIDDIYYACIKYVFINILEIMFYTEMYNRLVKELNEMHKVIDTDVVERIAHGIHVDENFELEYRKALDKLVEAC